MLNFKNYKKILILFFATTPFFAFAQYSPQNLNDLLYLLIDILYFMIPVLIGLAVLLFIWGLFRYYTTDNQNTKKEAVSIIGYGIVSIFVMVSLWGLVNLITYTLNLNSPVGPNNNFPTVDVKYK